MASCLKKGGGGPMGLMHLSLFPRLPKGGKSSRSHPPPLRVGGKAGRRLEPSLQAWRAAKLGSCQGSSCTPPWGPVDLEIPLARSTCSSVDDYACMFLHVHLHLHLILSGPVHQFPPLPRSVLLISACAHMHKSKKGTNRANVGSLPQRPIGELRIEQEHPIKVYISSPDRTLLRRDGLS